MARIITHDQAKVCVFAINKAKELVDECENGIPGVDDTDWWIEPAIIVNYTNQAVGVAKVVDGEYPEFDLFTEDWEREAGEGVELFRARKRISELEKAVKEHSFLTAAGDYERRDVDNALYNKVFKGDE